jgi:hypothetical protein
MSDQSGVGAVAGETRLIRLRPYDKKAGHTVKRYHFRGYRFFEEAGWYEVALEIADVLATKHINGDRRLPKIFDVCTVDEAKKLEAAEEAAKEMAKRATPDRPIGPRRAADFAVTRDGQHTEKPALSLAEKSAMPIVADGADGEPENDDEPDAGLVKGIGKLPDDDAAPAPQKAATPASRGGKKR